MAKMSFTNITSSTCTISITELQVYDANDPNSVNYTRVARIYMSTVSLPPSTVSGTPDAISSNIAKEDSSATISLKSLDANTTYYVRCNFYEFGKYDKYLATLTGEFTTKSAGGTTNEWNLIEYTSRTDTFKITKRISKAECYCIPITFSYSGKAAFYCDSSDSDMPADMIAFLSMSTSFDTDATSGQPTSILTSNDDSDKDYNDTMLGGDFGFEWNVVSGVTYYLFVREVSIRYEPGLIYIHCIAPAEESEYFEWSSAVAHGSPTRNVSHTEWDNFIDKIIEVLTDKKIINQPLTSGVYGYEVGTTFRTMLQDCYLTYDTELQGYPLTAQKFNVARFLIGSNLPAGGTTGISDKTSKKSKVLASDFITLENCLKTMQG